MFEIVSALGWIFVAASLAGGLYALMAGFLVGRMFRRQPPPAAALPAMSVLKPLHGAEPGLRCHLESFCVQAYPAPVQIIFGVQDPFDPAIEVVRGLQADHPDVDIELVIDQRLYGSNRKVSNLVNMERLARHPAIVLADSDIGVPPDYLSRLAAALAAPGVGFVTCPYVGKPTGNGWSQLAAMAINYHFLPSVALGVTLKLASPCFGSTIALRKETLDEIGGFLPLANVLADDFEIGRSIRAHGYGFALLPLVTTHACPEMELREVVAHELRWARTIRGIDPAGFFGSGVSHALPIALIGAALLHFSLPATLVLAFTAASRLYLMREVDLATGAKAGARWMTLGRDLLSFTIFLGALLVNSVSWQGRRFRIDADGVLSPY